MRERSGHIRATGSVFAIWRLPMESRPRFAQSLNRTGAAAHVDDIARLVSCVGSQLRSGRILAGPQMAEIMPTRAAAATSHSGAASSGVDPILSGEACS